jgi:cytidylate kinase
LIRNARSCASGTEPEGGSPPRAMLSAIVGENTTIVAKRGRVIAIDGPAGAGKSTLARGLARHLGTAYVNTGLMYRAVADLALRAGVDPEDGGALARLAEEISFSLGPAGSEEEEVLIEGKPPPASLSTPQVEAVVSRVARHEPLRAVLRRVQRRLGAGGSVMEGRDIGTVVFPDADLKIFLSAQPVVRARRRERERGGGDAVADAVARRDALDARTNPFVPAPDAHVLDTTALSREEVLAETLRLVEAAGPELNPGSLP